MERSTGAAVLRAAPALVLSPPVSIRRRPTPLQARRARNLRQLREAQGLSQPALAAAALVSGSFVQCIERGLRVPSDETLAALAKALGVSVSYLEQRLPPRPKKRFGALADRIRRAREDAGLLQRELARAVAVSVEAVQQIETGRLMPSHETLRRIAAVLGVRVADLAAAASAWRLPATARALREARAAAGLSRFRLAVRAGVTQSYVTAIETGRRHPSPDAARRFAEVLRVAPHALGVESKGTARLRRRVLR